MNSESDRQRSLLLLLFFLNFRFVFLQTGVLDVIRRQRHRRLVKSARLATKASGVPIQQ